MGKPHFFYGTPLYSWHVIIIFVKHSSVVHHRPDSGWPLPFEGPTDSYSLVFSIQSSNLPCNLVFTMLPPIPILSDYGISPEHGFLPPETPIEVLPDPYYAKWETVLANLQALLLSRRLRHTIDALPVLSTRLLKTEAEWRRAYVVLVFMLHGYIWGGDRPAEVR
jgi:hypothetical protein